MKAVYCKKYGGPEELVIREVPIPEPGANEVRVKIYATSTTAADYRIRSFSIPPSYKLIARFVLGFTKPRKPVLGVEFSGVVDAIGKNVTRFKTGDAVYALTLNQFGAYAEYICLNEKKPMALKPVNTSFEAAATLPVGGLTALHFIKTAQLNPNKQILIYGASGSVGTYAVQLAKLSGAKITAVCSASNLNMVKQLGADICLDYTAPDFKQQLQQYDVVFLAVDQMDFELANSVLKPGGMYINVTLPFLSGAMKKAAKKENKKMVSGKDPSTKISDLEELTALVEQGKLISVIDRTYTLDEIVEAHRYLDTGRKKGNVAITVNNH
jgi:NADPH:quinone reductase-like Zn-dependent oxidoreductase